MGDQPTFEELQARLPEIQEAIREAGLDGWLLYDLHARNMVAAKLVGHGDMSRRWFVMIPAEGEPRALVHGIEELPWEHWPWSRRRYVGWQELDEALRTLVGSAQRVAMEFSPGNAVPAVDLVPAGVLERVRATGVEVVSSADLVTLFHARWSAEQLASHRRAAAVLAQVAEATFRRLADGVGGGAGPREAEVMEWVIADLAARGCGVGSDCIVATGVNAANPHYGPADGGAAFKRGDVVLLDLWAKEAEDAVYADQTWMAYLGAQVPERPAQLFEIIRDARDAAVRRAEEVWASGKELRGYELDDAARAVVVAGGYGDYFIHRTGHSIDRDTHGAGPNIDNLETHETRLIVPGVGYSIEPGIYVPGDLGIRTEINVYVSEQGPEVTTPHPQDAVAALLPD